MMARAIADHTFPIEVNFIVFSVFVIMFCGFVFAFSVFAIVFYPRVFFFGVVICTFCSCVLCSCLRVLRFLATVIKSHNFTDAE